MFLNNSFNILPWYDSLEKQSSKKWYTFGQSWPLLCPKGTILPFQFVCEALEVTSNIQAVNVNTNEITDLGVAPSVIQGSQPNSTYYIVKLASVAVPALPVGTYYLRFKTSLGYLYSEEIAVIDDSNECIKVQYWNEDTLNFASGEINFADDFKFEFYIRSTIGKPEYEFEEELTKRLGYKFIESQTSNKVYKFAFVAPEYICDAMRLIRLCDYVKLTTKFDSYNALSFAYEPKWQDQGDLAAIDVEFDTDCIIQKLESFNRRIKESFYNALLADIDEPVLFSTDTVAQYYTEFTTTSFINGKLIRQLDSILSDELQSNLADLVLPIDNMADNKNAAKKVSLPDLMSLVNSSDISKLFKGHFDADGNLQWIEALSHIGVNGGVTMFIDNGTMSLPQLYAGLPIDGRTLIRDDNGVLMINPDIDLGGGLTEVYWDDVKLKPTFALVATSGKYADLSGLPDLSVYATTKYLTDELKKYVTLNTEQTIGAHKDFLNGLSVGGLGITKSQEDVIYLDANLVVRGGITMFGTNSVDIPTIMDAIATDNVNLKVVDGVLTFVGSSGGGLTEVYWDDVIGKPTLLSSFIDDVGYLQKSGGQMTGNIGYTLERDTTYSIGLPVSGSASFTDFYSFMQSSKTFIGSILNSSSGAWFDLISLRHTNGNGDEGVKYGMYIITKLNENDNLSWNKQINGTWQGERVILDSVNWSQYISTGQVGAYLPQSGGNMSGHIFMTGAVENSSTANTTQIVFGTSAKNHVCLTSNMKGLIINPSLKDTSGQIALYADINMESFIQSSLKVYGNLYADVYFNYNGNIAQSYGSSMYVWDNNLQINKTTSGNDYLKTLMSFDLINEDIELNINGKLSLNSYILWNSDSNNPYMAITYGGRNWYLQAYNNAYIYLGVGIGASIRIDTAGNLLTTGGITMYSDIRKKTKLADVELSLKQIADAPLIEHYYNSDSNKTTHVGSIAQYWAELNDWFCKLDSEGYYTMEIQNAALASAISIARELVKYESKTDKEIRMLKDEVKRLKKEIKILKSA